MSSEQTTLVLVKPDGVQRGLMGQILTRFEAKGLRVVGARMIQVDEALARQHYAEHVEKPFFPGLLKLITAVPVLALALRGREAVVVCRALIGSTDGVLAAPGTIRGDFGSCMSYNHVHGSDSVESAERELALWFNDGEIHDYQRALDAWVSRSD
jgi:nucleoside-diphosphate kinase